MSNERDKRISLIVRLLLAATVCRRINRRTGDMVILYVSMLFSLVNVFLLINYIVKIRIDNKRLIETGNNKQRKSYAVLGFAGIVYCLSYLCMSALEAIAYERGTGSLDLISGIAMIVFSIAFVAPKI